MRNKINISRRKLERTAGAHLPNRHAGKEPDVAWKVLALKIQFWEIHKMRKLNLQGLLPVIVAVAAFISVASVARAQQTMNIEIDYMVLRDQNGNISHTHQPQPDERDAVVQMFACHGITLNIEVDDEIEHQDVICTDPNLPLNFWLYTGAGGFRSIRNAHFDHAGQAGWHYCVFAHQYSSEADCTPSPSSGMAEFGDDFVVTLGNGSGGVGSAFERAATLAHEFGHNLGLRHCGDPLCIPGDNYKPNFASIMNYRYQMEGVQANLEILGIAPVSQNLFKNIDFSNGSMCILTEFSLDETFGSGMRSVDWNCDNSISGTVSHDLNDSISGSWCNASGPTTVITDYDEWNNLVDLTFKLTPQQLDALPPAASERCISYEEVHEMSESGLRQPPLVVENCINGKMVYLKGDASNPINDGSCEFPFRRLADAVASPLVPDGSVLYLRGGTYNETGAPLIIDRPLKISSVGTAVITVSPMSVNKEKFSK